MPRRQYAKPIASFEYGTRVYAPSDGEPKFRVIAKDPGGKRIFRRCPTEDEARQRAREIETSLASSVALPGRGNAPMTVGQLIDKYLASLGSRSTRYAERQEYLLRCWVRPVLKDHPLRAWTPADSDHVLDLARLSLAPATVQNLGGAMRALVTFSFKNRWLPREADPTWLVKYTPASEHQREAAGFIPRDQLPTDEQCADVFQALAEQDHPDWALAMRLKHRSGAGPHTPWLANGSIRTAAKASHASALVEQCESHGRRSPSSWSPCRADGSGQGLSQYDD